MATALSDIYGGFPNGKGALPDPAYRPTANEEFMSSVQLCYFRQKLLDWKEELLRESRGTMAQL